MLYASDEQAKLTGRFLDFIRILQDADITVSPAETIDMFSALKHIDFTDREVFKQTLATSLIKDYTDLPLFDKCFSEFFDRTGTGTDAADFFTSIDSAASRLMEMLGMKDTDLQRFYSDIDDILERYPDEELMKKSPRELLSLILEETLNAESGGALGMVLFNRRSRTPSSSEEKGSGDGEDGELLELVVPIVRRRMKEKNIGRNLREREHYLLNKYIYQLKPAEIQEMRDMVKRFGQKLKNRISLRKKRVKHGGLDVKKTFRSNLKFGGTPFKLYYRNRKIDRPQLVVLCDISGSVNQYSRFMLLLTYTLQSLFSKVRTFAFISNLVEITPLFMDMDPERALNSIFSDTDFTYGWGSNYGRCFNQFMRDYSDSLSTKTTVLILGDARNNNQDPGLDAFIRIKERSRNIFWMNPDRRHLWNWSDSIAGIYLPHCTEMKEVNNFMDLSDFIDKLFVRKPGS